jgi:hypothetical protein
MTMRMPKAYLTAVGATTRRDSDALGFDDYARAAMETYRTSYSPLPTCSVNEFGAFFSKRNFELLMAEIQRRAGNEPDANEVYETMMRAYSSVLPRSDQMDERREKFGPGITRSYVREMNDHVLEWAVEDVKAANNLWEHLAKYRHGPRGMETEDGLGGGIDTRTRLRGSSYDGTWLMP